MEAKVLKFWGSETRKAVTLRLVGSNDRWPSRSGRIAHRSRAIAKNSENAELAAPGAVTRHPSQGACKIAVNRSIAFPVTERLAVLRNHSKDCCMLKFPTRLMAVVVIGVQGFAGAIAAGAAESAPTGVITSSSVYDQTNADGSVSKVIMMVIKRPDGSSVIKTEKLPTTVSRDAQGRLVTSFVVPNSKMAVVTPPIQAPSALRIEELIAQRGRPSSVAEGPRKAIYRWPDVEVTVVGGVVTEQRPRNLEVEQAVAERTQIAAERQRQLQAERERQQQQLQQQQASVAPSPTPTPAWNPNVYNPRAGTTKEERIAEVRLDIERCRRIQEIYFKEISKPFEARRYSPAQRDLATAQLARLEPELETLERP